jgi:hypothetical protein
MACQGELPMKRNALSSGLALGLFIGSILTCSTLTPPVDQPTRPYAFVGDSLMITATIQDTNSLSAADTVQSDDSAAFIGIVYPLDIRVRGFFWDFGDGVRDTHAIVNHHYAKSGVYYAVFSIYDKDSFTIADTAMVCVNTPPDSLVLLSPLTGSVDELLTPELSWKAHDRDEFDSTLLYMVLINRGNGFVDTAITWSAATSLMLDRNFKKGESISWIVTAKDKFGACIVSDTGRFTMQPSSDASLAKLFLPLGNLTPPFSPDDTVYSDTVPDTTQSIDLDFGLTAKHATVTINDSIVPEGRTRVTLALPTTINIFIIRITSPDKSNSKTYSLTIVRRQATNALLASLHVSIGLKSVQFSETIFNYSDTVPWTTKSIDITPRAQDPASQISVKGIPIKSGDTSVSLPLAVGTNEIPITVTARDGETQKTYQLTVLRQPYVNASLSSLNISAGTLKNISALVPDTLRDTLSFLDSAVTLTPMAADTQASIFVDSIAVKSGVSSPSIRVAVGTTIVRIKITLPNNGETKTYVLLVLRKPDGTVIPTTSPSMLTAKGISVSSVRISWGDVAEATFYTLQRSRQAASGFSTISLPTSNSYGDTGLDSGSTYYYRVCASNAKGSGAFSATDSTVTFRRPFFTQQPQPQTASVGAKAIFSVVAVGIPAPVYKWQRNKLDITVNSAACTTGVLTLIDHGARYRCIIRSEAGVDTSTEAVLTVDSGPVEQPQDVSVITGEDLALIINVSESAYSIQWRKNGVDLPQAKSCTLSIAGVKTTDAGLYSVKVGNGIDSAFSKTFRLLVLPQSPKGLAAQARSALSMGISWNQAPGASWYRVLRASGAATVFASVCSTAQTSMVDTPLTEGMSYTYKVCAVNSDGASDTNSTIAATTLFAPRISVDPLAQVVNEGQTIILSVTAAALPACSYQWKKEGAIISAATSETYSRASVTVADSGDYCVVVTNAIGSVTSRVAHVSVSLTTPTYTLTAAAVPAAGGTIARSKNASSFLEGDTVRLTAHAAAGYRFAGWIGDTTVSDTSLRIIFRKNRTINPQFVRQWKLTASIGLGSGALSLLGDSLCDSGTAIQVTATPSATPAPGYRFNGWSGDTAGSSKNGNNILITMNRDKVVSAQFFRRCRLTTSIGSGQGTLSFIGDSLCDSGASIMVIATPGLTPAPGYRFSAWAGDTAGSSKISNGILITMNKNKVVNAQFFRRVKLSVAIGLGSGTLSLTGDSLCDSGTVVRVIAKPSATPVPGYRFSGWSGDTTASKDTLFIPVGQNRAINAQFMRQYQLSLSIGQGVGTMTPSGTTLRDSGAIVQVTATPSTPGYRFSAWSGDTAGTTKNNNILTVTMKSNYAIAAKFWRRYNLTLAFTGNGSIAPAAGTIVVDSAAATPLTITATPTSGYGFKSWHIVSGVPTVVDTSMLSTTILLRQGDASVTAVFTTIPTFKKIIGGPPDEEGRCVQQTADGGFIIVGKSAEPTGLATVYLIKTKPTGDTLWTKTYGTPGTYNSDIGYSVRQTTPDNGYIICGSMYRNSDMRDDIFLMKTDQAGGSSKLKYFGRSAIDIARSVQQTADGGYILTGTSASFGQGDPDMFVLKTDDTLGQQWMQNIYNGRGPDTGYCVRQNRDGSFIAVGTWFDITRGHNSIYLTKLDKVTGGPIWIDTLGGLEAQSGFSVQQTDDDGFMVSGIRGSQAFIIKTDRDGKNPRSGSFGNGISNDGYSMQQTTPDGGYILVGTTWITAQNSDIYLVKIGADGLPKWEKTFGDAGEDHGYSVQQTSDGGYIITGVVRTSTGNDVFLIKTDDNGNVY